MSNFAKTASFADSSDTTLLRSAAGAQKLALPRSPSLVPPAKREQLVIDNYGLRPLPHAEAVA